jgi:DNA polymerase I
MSAMYKRSSIAVIDIETNKAWDTIWMCGVYFPNSGTREYATNVHDLHRLLSGVDVVVGHNILGFDLPILEQVWQFKWNRQYFDTLVMGRLLSPMIEEGHSLRAWAERAGGELKDEFTDFDGGLTDAMIDYCLQDCVANWSVFEYMETLIEERGFSWASVTLEQEVRRITTQQEKNGFAFDFPKACQLFNEHNDRMQDITRELQEVFPPIIEERYSDKTGKRLKDKVTEFNPGSRQQVADRLAAKGAVWQKFTPTGQPKVDEKALEQNSHVPEAALVLEYLTLSKRIGMVRSWLDAVGSDGRIHGRVNTIGAITTRMSHSSPNMAQIPSEPQYRGCFIVAPGNKLVGIDASGLELRMLAHYMQDEEYTDLILHGDIHTHNQNLAGLPSRNDAKTFIYALLYGAGDGKIGSIIGGKARDGARLRAKFMAGLPAYAKLMTRIGKIIAKSGTLPGLDGRRLNVRSEHSALNTLLQSAGAIVMKKALVLGSDALHKAGVPYKLVAQVHDEFQIEAPAEHAEFVGATFRQAIIDAGLAFEMRCPLDGEAKIGNTWADTH